MKNLEQPHQEDAPHHNDARISPSDVPCLEPQKKRGARQKQKERRAGQYRKNKTKSFRHILLPYLEAVILCAVFAVFTSPASGYVFFASLIVAAAVFTSTRVLGNIVQRPPASPVLYEELMAYVRAAKFFSVAAGVFFLLPGVPGLFLPFAPLSPTESSQLWAIYPASHVVSWFFAMLSALFCGTLFFAPFHTPVEKEGGRDV